MTNEQWREYYLTCPSTLRFSIKELNWFGTKATVTVEEGSGPLARFLVEYGYEIYLTKTPFGE